jgi:hypothetical protein
MLPDPKPTKRTAAILDAIRRAARQKQFLEVVSAAEARRRFEERVDRSPLAAEPLPIAAALSRVIAAGKAERLARLEPGRRFDCVSNGKGLRRGDGVFSSRRIFGDRCACVGARRR